MVLRAILFNLLLLAIYCGLIVMGSAEANRGFNIAIVAGIGMAVQVFLNVVAGLVLLVLSKKQVAISLLVSAAVVGVVGFCSWLILLSIYG